MVQCVLLRRDGITVDFFFRRNGKKAERPKSNRLLLGDSLSAPVLRCRNFEAI
jgi:hypothetical protein